MTRPDAAAPPPVDDRTRIAGWADLVYLRRGALTHVLPFGSGQSTNVSYPSSMCGLRPALFDSWLGTGSQGEIDKAHRMPLCSRCLKLSEGRTR